MRILTPRAPSVIPLREDIRSGVSRAARDPARTIIHAGDLGRNLPGINALSV